MTNKTYGQNVFVHCSSMDCDGDGYALCQNSLMAYLSAQRSAWSNGSWTFEGGTGQDDDELLTAKLNDMAYGGVM